MRLQLSRPLVFFDLETTGKDTQTARIVQYALVRILPDCTRDNICELVNPGMPIPEESSAVHGITDDTVKDLPTFKEHAQFVLDFITGSDLAGFNLCAYDVPVLYHEFARAGINWDHRAHHVIDAGNLFKIREQRTLSAAVQFYTGEAMHDAHDALADTEATVNVLEGQLDLYDDLPATVEELALITNWGLKRADVTGKFTVNEAGDYVINFGANKGSLAKECRDYLGWMLSKDFSPDALSICREVLNPPKPQHIIAPIDQVGDSSF
jgi:DNA polymerase-3 subunit epsilon